MERRSVTGSVRLVAASMIGEPRTGSWSYKTARTTEMQKFFGLICCTTGDYALKLLTNQQEDGDSPVGKIVSGWLEKSRSIKMEGLR